MYHIFSTDQIEGRLHILLGGRKKKKKIKTRSKYWKIHRAYIFRKVVKVNSDVITFERAKVVQKLWKRSVWSLVDRV